MIKLARDRSTTAVPAPFRGQHRVNREKKLLGLRAQKPLESKDFDADHWKKAKPQLKAESYGKCAYCEGAMAVVGHGDVEHIRPKSVYWWLVYAYDNYAYSCQVCNQVHKGDLWPIQGTALTPPFHPQDPATLDDTWPGRLAPDPLDPVAGHPWNDFEQRRLAEEALVPDPYRDDPEALLGWEADDVLWVSVRARDATPRADAAFRGVTTVLGLNRETLRRQRYMVWKAVEDLVALRAMANMPVAAIALIDRQLAERMAASADFAAMVRYQVQVVHGLAIQPAAPLPWVEE